jgi:hypothetical protein
VKHATSGQLPCLVEAAAPTALDADGTLAQSWVL